MPTVGQRSGRLAVLENAVGEQSDHLAVYAHAFQRIVLAVGLGVTHLGSIVAGFLGLEDAEHLAGRVLADGATRDDRAFGAEEFEGVLGGGIGDVEVVVNDAVGAVAEADEDGRGVLDAAGV